MIQVNHHGAITQLVRYAEIISQVRLIVLSPQVKYIGFGIYLELLYFHGSNMSAHNDYNYDLNDDNHHNQNKYYDNYHDNHNT